MEESEAFELPEMRATFHFEICFFFNYFFGKNKISQILSKGNHNTVLILLDQSRIISFQL